MLIGLVSDIHGNYRALAAVLASAHAKGVDRFICAGDLVGYYYDADLCLAALEAESVDYVSGNHDRMLVEMSRDSSLCENLTARFGSSYHSTLPKLTESQLAWLSSLPAVLELELDGRRVSVAHGSLWSDLDYVYHDSDDMIEKLFSSASFDICVLGNTHRQLHTSRGNRAVVNPGSVGQPRGESRGLAQWALLRTADMSIEFLTETYNNGDLAAEARLLDPTIPYLWEVLSGETG